MLSRSFQFILGRFSSVSELSMKDFRNISVVLFVCYLIVGQVRRSVSHEPAKLMVVPARNPSRFFPRGSPVKDYYWGNTTGLALETATNDLTFVFLYAPWCLFSQYARSEFESTARIFQNQAAFVAVNCAWHAGACARHKRPENFPVIGAYVGRNQRFFITYRGVPTGPHLEIFVRRLLQPYLLISRAEDYHKFIHTNDIAVIASVQMKHRENRGLQVFWNTSLLIARHETEGCSLKIDKLADNLFLNFFNLHDPRGAVGLAVVGDHTLARKFGLLHSDSLHIFRLGKEIQMLPQLSRQKDTYCEEVILQKIKSLPFKWIFATFHKSFALAETLQNATLLFFTPFQPDTRGLGSVDSLIHRIGALYSECNCNTDFLRLILADEGERLKRQERHLLEKERCRILEQKFDQFENYFFRQKNSLQQNCVCLPEKNSEKWTRDVCLSRNCPFGSRNFPFLLEFSTESMTSDCSSFFSQNRIFSSCFFPKNPFLQIEDRNRILAQIEICRNPPFQRTRPQVISQSRREMENRTVDRFHLIHGLKCSTNRSLDFLAIDPILYPHFVETLGISLDSSSSKMVIIDKKASEKYVYEGDLTPFAIADFVANYTKNFLVSFRKSTISFSSIRNDDSDKISKLTDRKFVKIGELTAQTFSTMLDSEKDDVIVLYYTPWCTFCKTVQSTLYNLAALLRNVSGLSFQKINIQDNDLSWENKIVNVPTIQIFSTKRKRDNVATFPSSASLNLLNLLKFTLLHVSPKVWSGLVSSRCGQECWQINQGKAKRLLRVLKKEIKILRNVFFSGEKFCDIRKLKWRIARSRLKRKLLKGILSADSADFFVKSFLSANVSAIENLENRHFLRNFFFHLGIHQ